MHFNNYGEFFEYHRKMKQVDKLRLGQRFVNNYIKHVWPELYYMEDDAKAEGIIIQWMNDHSYGYTGFPAMIIEIN